jgi:uncharacterized protein
MGNRIFDPGPALGLAYSDYVPDFLREHPDAVDYVEVPFENLHYSPGGIELPLSKPAVLHCASLSIAGHAPPSNDIVSSVARWAVETETPWVGEHLAFVTAAGGPRERYDIGYAINAPTNEEALGTVARAVTGFEQRFGVPVLIENPPVYFTPPGSTMTQPEFLRELCARAPVRLLVDLTHVYLSARVRGADPLADLAALPLDWVVEVHVSGVRSEAGGIWDDHTTRAPDLVFEMLEAVLLGGRPRAITLEYNWSVSFPIPALLEEIARTRGLQAKRGSA